MQHLKAKQTKGCPFSERKGDRVSGRRVKLSSNLLNSKVIEVRKRVKFHQTIRSSRGAFTFVRRNKSKQKYFLAPHLSEAKNCRTQHTE